MGKIKIGRRTLFRPLWMMGIKLTLAVVSSLFVAVLSALLAGLQRQEAMMVFVALMVVVVPSVCAWHMRGFTEEWAQMKRDIRGIKKLLNEICEKVFPGGIPPYRSESPIRLTNVGEAIATKVNADALLGKYYDTLKKTVDKSSAHNAYDIHRASMDAAIGLDGCLTDDEKDSLKNEAFSRGFLYENVLGVIGIMLRDRLLKERGISVPDNAPAN